MYAGHGCVIGVHERWEDLTSGACLNFIWLNRRSVMALVWGYLLCGGLNEVLKNKDHCNGVLKWPKTLWSPHIGRKHFSKAITCTSLHLAFWRLSRM
ncbi:hypothetical protein GDO81_028493 [Engystomops pustulosus]|uniref:Uncharacterized protein n=1 Tax=Engystomops pustulosus TaxID=76066 RepID=A0AAV6ZDC8_ENGPU|nr:hypothetical protein GDO81_028493 [Engystomops pustulosus]